MRAPQSGATLAEVNARLKQGEGSIFYRHSKNAAGERVSSRFLYYAFYPAPGAKQKFVKTQTNDPEQAYRELLAARKPIEQGNRLLPSEVGRVRYEDLIQLLMDYYRDQRPASLYPRKTEDGGTEQTFGGKDEMDKFFRRLPVTQITSLKIQEYIKWQRGNGVSGPTIRRQLNRLRSAFNLAKQHDLLTDNNIPSFVLPKDSEPRQGFLEMENFEEFLKKFPENIKPTVEFYYYTGARTNSIKLITWAMVSAKCDEITVPAAIIKNNTNWEIPLVGPLEPIAKSLREMRKSFPAPDAPVFDFTNFRKVWNQACADMGFGTYDKKTCNYTGLHPHDFRRSAARNLIKAGVLEQVAMKITGHKTREIFRRYNIQTSDDVKEALIRVGAYKAAAVVPISAPSRRRKAAR